MKADSSVQGISLRTGSLVSLGLIAFFLLMKLMRLQEVLELRLLNIFFMLAGIIYAIKYLKEHEGDDFGYLEGFTVGALTAFYSSFFFGFFIIFYLWLFDPAFMTYLHENAMFGKYLNPGLTGLTILVEGTSSGLVIAFSAMQYYKRE